jgi:cyclopropane fatty-acyl-phospholipid synthase-like methyltransferase
MTNYDRISELYHGEIWGEEEQKIARQRIHWICSQAKGTNILDMGCSQGITSILLGREGFNVIGVDIREDAVEYANQSLKEEPLDVQRRVKFQVGNAVDIEAPEGGYDSIILGEIIEHQTDPDRLINAAIERLQPEGRIIITLPFGYHPDPDHKKTYYLYTIINTLSKLLHIEKINIQNKYILCTASKLQDAKEKPDSDYWQHILKLSENVFEETELTYHSRHNHLAEKSKKLTESLKAKLEESRTESRKKTEVHQQYQQNKESQLNKARKTIKESNDKIQLLTEQLEDLQEENKQKINDLREETRQLTSEIKAKQQIINEIEDKKSSLSKQLQESQQQAIHMERELKNAGMRGRQWLKQLEHHRDRVLELDQRIKQKDILLRKSNHDLGHIRNQVRYKLGDALVSCIYDYKNAFKLPKKILGLYLEGLAKSVLRKNKNKQYSQLESGREIRHEIRYKLGDSIVSSFYRPKKIVKLPVDLSYLFLEGFARHMVRQNKLDIPEPNTGSALPVTPAPIKPIATKSIKENKKVEQQNREFKENLDRYLAAIAKSDQYDEVVLMFSGTIHIQEKRANRPIRMTRVLIEKNVPVLFSYFRWNKTDPIPDNYDHRLFQSPIDKTMEFMREIMKYDFDNKKKTFILSFPYPAACRYINEFNAHGWTTLYDVRDEWEEFEKVGMAKWFNKESEIYAVNNCDLVTTVSWPLQNKMQDYTKNKQVHLCPNAYDKNFLKEGVIGERNRDTEKDILGYFGHLTDRWFDWEFVIRLARTKPEWQIDIIGHGIPEDIELPKNINYLGFLGHSEICKIAKSWKCAMIPFKISKLAEGVDPIKIYEYLALGLPTVSLTMPQISDYPYVSMAKNMEEFIAGVEKSFAIKTDPKLIRKWLAENTWEKRVEQMSALSNTDDCDYALKKLCN